MGKLKQLLGKGTSSIKKSLRMLQAYQDAQQTFAKLIVTSGKSFIIQLLGIKDIATKFNLVGTAEEVKELKEVIRVIASVPAGHQILKKAVVDGTISQISFSPSLNWGGHNVRGIFYGNKSIKIVKIDTSLPKMSDMARLMSRAIMASVLAHEMQHGIDDPKNIPLMRLASNVDECVLACILIEMSAYSHQEQFENQLYTRLFRFTSRKRRTKKLKEALSGKDPFYKWYIHKTRKETSDIIFKKQNPDFRELVTNRLKEMKIDMSFEEAMRYTRESLKLLPAPSISKPNHDR